MTGGYDYPSQQQHQEQQQQPMQVSPEQPANPALGQPQGQMQTQQQPQGAYANYQYNQYAQPPRPLQLQPNMQPFQAHGSMTMPANAQQQQRQLVAQMASPPVSPLWTPASPNTSPPEEDQNKIQQGSGMPLSLPTGFVPSAGAPVPKLPPVGGPVADPFDASTSALAQTAQAPPPPPADPFGSGAPPVQPPTQQQKGQDEADFWNDMGFGNALPANDNDDGPVNVTPTSNGSDESLPNGSDYPVDRSLDRGPVSLDERGLPAGGEYYKARVTTPMLGAIFSSGRELRSTLYKTASDSFVEAIGDRPVISFTIDGSAADTAGIGLGHVLLKVNDQEVSQTDQAVKTVGSASRPMIMEFYIPNKEIRVVKTEGQCMVKYDNHSTEAPASACEWKPKYVVMGDMLGKPHILYMYRSKVSFSECMVTIGVCLVAWTAHNMACTRMHLTWRRFLVLPSAGRVRHRRQGVPDPESRPLRQGQTVRHPRSQDLPRARHRPVPQQAQVALLHGRPGDRPPHQDLSPHSRGAVPRVRWYRGVPR